MGSFLLYMMNVGVIFIVTSLVFQMKDVFKVSESSDVSHQAIVSMRNQVRLDRNMKSLDRVRQKIKMETMKRKLTLASGEKSPRKQKMIRKKTMALMRLQSAVVREANSQLDSMEPDG